MDNLGYKILVSIPGYEILHELGRGGMSTVYLAIQESLQRQLALKVISPTLSVDPSFKDRFLREGRTLGQLTHPNIVIIYDIGLSASRYFIAMEYVGSGTLGERIQQGLPLDESLRIVKDIGRALHYAHRRGFVHRDVKPSNILFREDDTPVLGDFGIARSIDSNTTHLTKTGLSVGTPSYMSPEQVAGRTIDGRSDLYSLGIVFYEMLTGAPPYRGESIIATSLKHLTEPVPQLPQPLSFLQPVMERMLAKAPNDRFSDVQAFIEALDRTTGATPRAAPPREELDPTNKAFIYDETKDKECEPVLEQPPPRNEPPKGNAKPAGPRVWIAEFRRQRSWQLSAGLTFIALLAVVAALLVRQPALPEHIQTWVDERLRTAEQQVSKGHLLEPMGNNAVETYRHILAIAPGYKKALTGLQQIAGRFESEARGKRQAGKPQEGLALIAQALQIYPEHEGLLRLRNEITQQLQKEQREHEITSLLEKARRQFEAWLLVEPADGNAWQSYRAVLERDPKNKQALQGLANIADRLERLARTKYSGGDLEGALEDVAKGLKVDPQHAGLRAQKQRLTVEKQLAAAEQQLRDGYLVSPAGNNAFETYQSILSEQPERELVERARAGLRAVATHIASLAKSDWAAGRARESLDRLDIGIRLFKGLPGYGELQALRDEI
ncbi:MAG: protein kinase, partial [Gammaproteobacteria bacterium]